MLEELIYESFCMDLQYYSLTLASSMLKKKLLIPDKLFSETFMRNIILTTNFGYFCLVLNPCKK